MGTKFYNTDERNVQIVIGLLKEHGIHRIIASPGTTNMTFVNSVQHDSWFQVWSSVDERSAAYLACGMASVTGEPVILTCTGATASRNYMSGLTEAYYRKLPVLAITSTRGNHCVGHLMDQQIDRRSLPNDIAVESVTIPIVKDSDDENYCVIEANKAILALKLNGGGPAHINMYSKYSRGFGVKELPPVRAIYRYTQQDIFPELPHGLRVAIFVGAHKRFSERQITAIENFCATHDAVVFVERTCGYYGKYACSVNLISSQKNHSSSLLAPDIIINIGEVNSGLVKVKAKETWRVSEDGALRDPWHNLTKVFMMPEEVFFEHYSQKNQNQCGYLKACQKELQDIIERCPDLPFGNAWIAQNSAHMLPSGSTLFLGIYNSLRSWSFFNIPDNVETFCNVGGFGIDGGISTLMGASLVQSERLHFGVFGDLGFFYDMNVLGNRHVGKNVRIMVINNACGVEFRNYGHPCYFLGEEADAFIAASGHYGNKSKDLVKHYAEDLGFEYLFADTKESYLQAAERFFTTRITDKSMLLEVFTDKEKESEALEIIFNIEKGSLKERTMVQVKEALSKSMSPEAKAIINRIVK